MTVNFAPLRSMVTLFLTDTCTIATAGTVAFDENVFEDVDTPGDEVYDGPCRVAPAGGARIVAVGEGTTSLRLFDVTVPWDTTGINLEHLVTITDSGDPYMVGRVLRVVDVLGESNNAYRRLICEDTLDPEETGS